MYHVIGDSHTTLFSLQQKILQVGVEVTNGNFNCYHVGPVLAYNARTTAMVTNFIESVPEEDSIIFCFGEIDLRNVHKRIVATNSTYQQKIDEIIFNYTTLINFSQNPNKIIFGVIPCLKEIPFYDWFKEVPERMNEFYAPVGDLATRNMYKQYYNSRLKEICNKEHLQYFDIFSEVLYQEEYYMDDIHLSSEKVFKLVEDKFADLL